MNRAEGIQAAEAKAAALVHRCGVTAPEHVNPGVYAKKLGARIVDGRLQGAQAQLVRTPDDITILISDRVRDERARNFIMVHELGHLVLSHPSCSPSELFSPVTRGPSHKRTYEGEASTYSGAALMPEALVRPLCDVPEMTLDVAWQIMRLYPVSILASSIRCTQLASLRCAAVFASRGVVKWFAPSATCTRWVPRGMRLDPDSNAFAFFERGTLDESARRVPGRAWFKTDSNAEILEQSIGSAVHGTTLSMLWIPESSAAALGMK
jgi:Zn-dependent peptidase ImmA (M78 family)